MLRTIARLAVAGVAAAALAFSGAASASAASPIGPKQFFVGYVNGSNSNAIIQTGCFGPIGPGFTGHPLPNQYVYASAVPSSTTTKVGYTGDAARALAVSLVLPPITPTGPVRVYPIGTLTLYDTKLAIPTTLTLPCSGSGQVVFEPTPTSTTARAAIVNVMLVGQP
jgi:hypothetical protein